MRKALFILILFTSISTTVFAQTFLLKTPEIHIGASQGATASMLYFAPAVKQDVLFGYNGGLLVRYTTEKGKALQVELNYSQRGWAEKENLYARRLDYLELPFLMHLFWGEKTNFFFNLGPKVSFLLNESVLYNNAENSTMEQHTRDIYNLFDYGVTAGMGFQFPIKKQCFLLETRANFSLSTAFSNNKRNYYGFSNNMNLALNLAWLMRVNKEK